jgi:hypothetical protein
MILQTKTRSLVAERRAHWSVMTKSIAVLIKPVQRNETRTSYIFCGKPKIVRVTFHDRRIVKGLRIAKPGLGFARSHAAPCPAAPSKASLTMKSKRAAFSASFLLSALAAPELEGIRLEDI